MEWCMYTTFINALVYYEDQKGIILSFVKKIQQDVQQ